MRKFLLALGATAMVAPTLVATTVDADAQRRYKYREWRGSDGRIRCRRSDGTTGLVVGAVAGGLLGRTIDTRGDRTLGTVLGGVGGALAGREIERSSSTRRCR
ncbi:MAG: glycine zipper 2TM domain-containing protein [Sphingomonas adhaesiva]|uniref:glycine zipper 2TM domain-containing protein n=1 Tax=Sphingomonas adhaesiva TaxID=28212 RepID=UPI002FF7AAC4